MERHISATEANQNFAQILREVRSGETFIVTTHGKPVARIIPCQETEATRLEARQQLFARLAEQPVTDIGPWRRDDLYER